MSSSVRVNEKKNRLYLVFDGFIDNDEATRMSTLALKEVKKLKAGFSVINDISKYKPTGSNVGDIIKNFQAELVNMGMTHVVRIIGDNETAQLQFNRRGKEAGYGKTLKVETAPNLEEAEKLLP